MPEVKESVTLCDLFELSKVEAVWNLFDFKSSRLLSLYWQPELSKERKIQEIRGKHQDLMVLITEKLFNKLKYYITVLPSLLF